MDVTTHKVRLGRVDVSFAVTRLKVKSQMSDRPKATLSLDTMRAPSSAIDLSADLSIVERTQNRAVFTGEITSATLVGQQLDLTAQTGMALSDEMVSDMNTFGMEALEMVRTLLVHAGLTQNQFSLEGLQVPELDYFEVVFPVHGLKTDERVYLAGVSFVPQRVLFASPWFAADLLRPSLRDAFAGFDTFVVVGVTATWATDAEELARARAVEALALIAVDARCSVVAGPGQVRRRYLRSDARAVPALAEYCALRAVATGRGWIRETSSRSMLKPADLSAIPNFGALFIAGLPDDLKLTALSVYQAVTGEQTLTRNLALWDAVEFYAGTVKVPDVFTRSDQKVLLRQIVRATEWNADQRARLVEVKQMLNARPLLWRLRKRLVGDEVPFTDAEFGDLKRLRTSRNDTVHGRHMDGPTDTLVRSGVGLLSRAVVYSAARIAR